MATAASSRPARSENRRRRPLRFYAFGAILVWLTMIAPITVLFGLAYAGMFLTPVSYWYDVGDLVVRDATQNAPAELEYAGGAVRHFLGSYTVVAREFGSRGIVCEAQGGPFQYDPAAIRPDPLTMDWWAPSDARCSALPVGVYTLETCWTVHRPFFGLVPNKTQCIVSPPFWVRLDH